MRSLISEEKKILMAPFFIILGVFFTPLNVNFLWVILVLSMVALVSVSYYRTFLWQAFTTLWAGAALTLFLYVLIACFWSEAPYDLRWELIEKYSKLICLPFLAVGFINPKTRKLAFNVYFLSLLLTCFVSLLKHYRFLAINPDDPGQVFYNHIMTSFMVALAVYLAVILFFQENKNNKWQRAYYLLMMLVGSYQIFFLNMGRTGYVIYILLISLVIVQKLSFKKAIIAIVLLLGFVGTFYLFSPVMQFRVAALMNDIKLMKEDNKNTSLGFRVQFHDYAHLLFKEHPIIGIGTGGFKYRFNKDKPVVKWDEPILHDPHNQYWLVLSDLGSIGFLLYVVFLASLFIAAFKLSKETKSILLGMLVAFCFGSFTDSIFCYSAVGTVFIIISSLCLGELIGKQNI